MTLTNYKIIAALLIFLVSILSVIYPLRTNRDAHVDSFELGEAFASGIFLGVAFFHLLPHANEIFSHLYYTSYPIGDAICIGSFLFFIFLERLSLVTSKINPQQNIPYIMTLILIIHALTEGAALGVGKTFAESLLIFIAIIAHKGSASFALCITLLRYHLKFGLIVTLILLFSLMTPLGVALGTWVDTINQGNESEAIAAIFNAFAAGSFIYIATMLHIRFHERMHKDKHPMMEYFSLLTGVVLMGLVAVWL